MNPAISRGPRPLDYIRIRVYRGGQAEFIQQLFEDEKADLFDDLKRLRGQGKAEDDPEVVEVAANIRHLINALRDLNTGMIELVGGDGF
jgi:hypothetical protein